MLFGKKKNQKIVDIQFQNEDSFFITSIFGVTRLYNFKRQTVITKYTTERKTRTRHMDFNKNLVMI